MNVVSSLLARLLAALHGLLDTDLCPGGWAWAVTALGVAVGLLPAVGAAAVALLRRRIGSRYGVAESTALVGTGLLTAGLLPLLAFNGTGRVFAAAGGASGLTARELRSLQETSCLAGPQSRYLGGIPVADAFSSASPVRFALSLVLLVFLPLVATMFVAAQARLVLRRGPSWPARAFWLPVLGLAVATLGAPAGSTGQLWIGFTAGTLLGVVVALVAGVPSRETVRRSLQPPSPPSPPAAPRAGGRGGPPRPPPPLARPVTAAPPRARSAPLDRGPQAPVGGPPASPYPPTLLAPGPPLPAGAPRFRMISRLGAGGFGRVWLAHDARLGHNVALKAAHAPDAETEERIRREAGALVAIRHPNCVRIHDLVPATSDPGLADLEGMVIVMEYVEGTSLGELVRSRGCLDDIAAARVWTGVAGALDAAHTRGVLHRDVKPGNVVVDHGGLAHLIDFGIARRTGDATMTMAGFVLGTPDFLAPEVAAGQRATPASDAWQLAATVSFALTGHPPRGVHPDAVSGLRAAATGAPLSHLPARTAHLSLLRAAMDNDPARRPPLRAVSQALDGWLWRTGSRPDGPVTASTGGR